MFGAWLAQSALGSAERSTLLVEIPTALAADLALLTQALDEPGVDIADTLRHVATSAKFAVRSYLGMTVTERTATSDLTLTTGRTRPTPAISSARH